MPEPVRIAKARLEELQADLETPRSGGKRVTVQFNPESLKVNFANQIQAPQGSGGSGGSSGDSARPPAVQFVGAGTTKLAVTLWFDASAPLDAEMLPEAERGAGKVDDVRKLTEQVAWFITPQPDQADPDRYLPPAVSFAWGSFLFNGIVESIEENLEFFSPEGKPLRASLLLKLIKSYTMYKQQMMHAHQNCTCTLHCSNNQVHKKAGALPGVLKAMGINSYSIWSPKATYSNPGLGHL